MEDELSLPRLLPDSQSELPLTLNLRKRVRLSSPDVSLSSDLPIFSSDDDPSADNYTILRRKKIYRGPWFRQELVDSNEKPKRTLQRQVDSGVWMGSDGTDLDDVPPEFEELVNMRFEDANKKTGTRKGKLPELSLEAQAERYVEECLDNGNESIDLIACGLKTLSNRAIQLLSTFTCAPDTNDAPFQTLEPKLKLLLSNNYFVRIPREILNLQHLQVLSFRANQLREIPPAICQLQQLIELNVANNCLHFLPVEILELFGEKTQLREFHIHPNPFYEPDLPAKDKSNQEESEPWMSLPRSNTLTQADSNLADQAVHAYWRTTYCFASPVSFFNIKGTLARGPAILSCEDNIPQKFPVIEPGDIQSPPGHEVSAAPSLLEVALRACYQSTQLPYLADLLHSETPSYFYDLLNKAQTLKEAGGQKCTICGRDFIIPRTSWIEWWEISKIGRRNGSGLASAASPLRSWEEKSGRDQIEAMVPLLRMGCSWKCYSQAQT